jgi:uncharacterized RDD family membrane protein YckC
MKKTSHQTLLPLGLALLLAFGALAGSVFAQSNDDKTTPPPPPAEEKKTAPVPAKAAVEEKISEAVDKIATKIEEAADKIEAKVDEAAAQADSGDDKQMRRLDSDDDSEGEKPARKSKRRSKSHSSHSDDPKFGGQTVAPEKRRSEAITIMGDTVVDGAVSEVAVSVLGNTTVNGSVGEAAVSVLGTTTVNGSVGDAAIAVLGDVVLGPKAEVNNVVVVMGQLKRAEGSVVKGDVQEIGGFGPFKGVDWLHAYVKKCIVWGRPLWFGENLGWAWLVAAGFLLFYLFLALLFPSGVSRCAEMLEQKPGDTIVTTLLTMMITPLAFVLLAITGVGVAVIPFLAAGLFCAGLFGKAAMLGWLGRRLVGPARSESMARDTLLAVLVGGLIVMLLYCIPILGFLLYKVFGILGTGLVVYTFIVATRKEKPAKPAAPAPAAPLAAYAAAPVAAPLAPATPAAMPAQSAGFGGSPSVSSAEPAAAPAPEGASPFTAPQAAPLLSASTLSRAGFWIRAGAAFLDFVMIGMACGFLNSFDFIDLSMPGFLFLALAAYSAAMWKNKGTTIGGVICGLKVVRVDDRPIDWTIAIVRALSGFLSFFAAGVGFIWVAFDDEKQSWHDKIAGTTIVRVPKGTSLL